MIPTSNLASDWTLDPWQQALLDSPCPRQLVLASRRAGKTTVAARIAEQHASAIPLARVVIQTPSAQMTMMLLDKIRALGVARGDNVVYESPTVLRWIPNGSSVAVTDRFDGSPIDLVVVDEACDTSDIMFNRYMARLRDWGRIVALSSPGYDDGWFYDQIVRGDGWDTTVVRAADCPRFTPEFLASERARLSPDTYRQQYECEFTRRPCGPRN